MSSRKLIFSSFGTDHQWFGLRQLVKLLLFRTILKLSFEELITSSLVQDIVGNFFSCCHSGCIFSIFFKIYVVPLLSVDIISIVVYESWLLTNEVFPANLR
uniref:Uncharacterized protein n=1 Tax=Solanum lycopersicum TaxID=4081 RepID=A0A3Q7J0W4_SOLLC